MYEVDDEDMDFEDDESEFYDDEEEEDDDDAQMDFIDTEFEIYEPEEEERVYAIRPNKTQIKKEIEQIAALAEKIVRFPTQQLKAIELPDNVYAAASAAATMPHKGTRKRQLKYITAELRKLDLSAIEEKFARQTSKSAHTVREHHLAERWRDHLIADTGHTVLTQLLDQYPHADSQHIRQLQRNAKKELATQKPPKSARLLYKYLKSLIETPTPMDDELPDFTEA